MFKRIDFLKTVPTVGVPRFEENTSFGEGRTFLAGRESKAQIRLEMAAATGPNCRRVRSEKTWLGTGWRRETNWGRRVSKLARELEVTRVRAPVDQANWPQKVPRDRCLVIWGSPGAPPEAWLSDAHIFVAEIVGN
jgi:hypothetical protein